MEEYKTVLGTYQDVYIYTDTNKIPARAYVSKRSDLIGKHGFFLLKLNEGWDWWVICNYIPFED